MVKPWGEKLANGRTVSEGWTDGCDEELISGEHIDIGSFLFVCLFLFVGWRVTPKWNKSQLTSHGFYVSLYYIFTLQQ